MSELTMHNMIAPDKEGQRMDAKIRVSEIQKQLRELQAKSKKEFLDGLKWQAFIFNLLWLKRK